jgi:hypothetical protein
MKTIQHTQTLFYYDGPQIFEARDAIGGHYVALMVEPDDDHDQYLVTGVAPERLRQFRSGSLDLRTLLAESGENEWYLTKTEAGLEQALQLVMQDSPLLDSGLLPEPGFVLRAPQAGLEALETEPVELVGALEKADMVSGWWRLATPQGRYTGRIKAGGPSLAGLRLGGSYHFVCLPGIDEVAGAEQEQRILFLVKREPASPASLCEPA